MYCGKCGTSNPEGASFCRNCGAPIKSANVSGGVSGSYQGQSAQSNQKYRIIGISAVAVVCIVVLIVVFSLFGRGDYKSVVNKFMNSMMDGDVKQVMSCFPDEVMEYQIEQYGYDKQDWEEWLEENTLEASQTINQLKSLGAKVKITFDITDTESYTKSELTDLNETYDTYEVNVDDAKKVTGFLRMKVGEESESTTLNLIAVKIKGHWYIDYNSVSKMFN